MSVDHPDNGNGTPSWLSRLNKALSGEPQDRDQLIDVLRDAERRNLVDAQAYGDIEALMAHQRPVVRVHMNGPRTAVQGEFATLSSTSTARCP